MAGDLSARIFHEPTAEELDKDAALINKKSGNSIRTTWVTETISMASDAAGADAAAGFAQGRRSQRVSLLRYG